MTTEQKAPRPHFIRPRWLRRLLRVLAGLVVFVLLLPVLVYLPPVQTLLKDVACDVVGRSTGMKVDIERFRLRYPLDVELQGVRVLEASGDTMASASSLIADVKILPLLKGDIDINKLELHRGFYSMLSADSSMTLRLHAGLLRTAPGSEFRLADMRLRLRDARLDDADVSVVMNVWKQKKDTAPNPTKFLIEANALEMNRVRFSMSMLPTLDSLDLLLGRATVKDATVNLTDSKINIGSVEASRSLATILMPTAEYVKSHPAPVDTVPAAPSVPMVVEIGRIALSMDTLTYATVGAKPLAGYDPSYIQVTEVKLTLADFYNCQSTLRLPLLSLTAKERSGLEVTSARGLLSIDSDALNLKNFALSTPNSELAATAHLPFALMAMDESAPQGEAVASGRIGWADIFAFMPALRATVGKMLPAKALQPIVFNLDAQGDMSRLNVESLKVNCGLWLALRATGFASSFMNPRTLRAHLDLDGAMRDPSLLSQILMRMKALPAGMGPLPSFSIKGSAEVSNQTYTGDIRLLTSAGNIAAKGFCSLSPERYDIDATFNSLEIGSVMPSLGLGTLSGHLSASGAGFNPMLADSRAQVDAHFSQISYQGNTLAPLSLTAVADRGEYALDLNSEAPHASFAVNGTGYLQGSTYFADLKAHVNYIDLQAFGLTPDVCRGSGDFAISGSADPQAWLYDLTASLSDVDWEYGSEFYRLNVPLAMDFLASERETRLALTGQDLDVEFASARTLKPLIDEVSALMPRISEMIEKRDLNFQALQEQLPPFTLNFDALGNGLVAELLEGTGISLQSLRGSFSNTERLGGEARLLTLNTGSMVLDTITLQLTQRQQFMDYRVHVGNRAGNLPEFAQVTATGRVGTDQASIMLHQANAQGQTGYHLGLKAAMPDSVLKLNVLPSDAIIAYKPWTINAGNHIDLGPGRRVAGNLEASSGESSISLQTTQDSLPGVNIRIKNLLVQDFLNMVADAPPLTGALDTDMHLAYLGNAVGGQGDITLRNVEYNEMPVGNLGLGFRAGVAFNGNTAAELGLTINDRKVIKASGYFLNDTTTMRARSARQPVKLNVELLSLPLAELNPFLPEDMLRVRGALSGKMAMTGSLAEPLLNGVITCDSVGTYIPMAGTWLRFDPQSTIAVEDNNLRFNDFHINTASGNPLVLDGYVDARRISDIRFDLALNGQNTGLIDNKSDLGSDIYGKLFLNLGLQAKGSLERMNVNANVEVLPATNIYYNLSSSAQQKLTQGSNSDVVKFVNFSDSVQVAAADTLEKKTMAMRLTASLDIVQGAMVTVNLSGNGTDKAQIYPSGSLSFLMTYMGDMRLNGTLNLPEGFARYSVPALGEKSFSLLPDSYVAFNGNYMNPLLHILATDHVKANVQQAGANSRLIYFDVGLTVTGSLSSPQIAFDISTDDDLTVQNELEGMTAEQRQAAAINLLLYNTYTGTSVKATANLGGNPIFSFLTGQLNSLAARYVKGVGLSFGIDQYKSTVGSQSQTATSYSYQVSKSLFDNKFKIVVGGNYSTDADADDLAENLIADVSFEYQIRRTANSNMYVRLFRHTGFKSILEGEITETGVGLAYRRRLANLRSLFRFGKKKHKESPTDTLPEKPELNEPSDTVRPQ